MTRSQVVVCFFCSVHGSDQDQNPNKKSGPEIMTRNTDQKFEPEIWTRNHDQKYGPEIWTTTPNQKSGLVWETTAGDDCKLNQSW